MAITIPRSAASAETRRIVMAKIKELNYKPNTVARNLKLIEAMADAAVSGGMPRKQAYQFAAQAVLGSAKMVLDTGKHPGELKDMVCSPAGTTIEAVRTLEELGFRSSIIEAMKVCEEMSRSL